MSTCGYADRVSPSSLTVGSLHVDFARKYGDLSTKTIQTTPLHSFRLDLARSSTTKPGHCSAEMEFELSERLDLDVSAKGVVGRQVTMSDASGILLGVGVVGYN